MGYKTALYMRENGKFPAPIIVLDNRDGHLKSGVLSVPKNEKVDLSHFNAAPITHLSGYSFESQWAFPT